MSCDRHLLSAFLLLSSSSSFSPSHPSYNLFSHLLFFDLAITIATPPPLPRQQNINISDTLPLIVTYLQTTPQHLQRENHFAVVDHTRLSSSIRALVATLLNLISFQFSLLQHDKDKTPGSQSLPADCSKRQRQNI